MASPISNPGGGGAGGPAGGPGGAPPSKGGWTGKQLQGVGSPSVQSQMERVRIHGGDSRIISGHNLEVLGIELGLSWDAFGRPGAGTGRRMALADRNGTDAELTYLQVAPIVPFALLVTLYGGALPTLLWTDFGREVQPGGPMPYGDSFDKRSELKLNYWKVINSAGGHTERFIDEPTSLVFTAYGYDMNTYSYRINANQIVGVFADVPREMVTDPKVEWDDQSLHYNIVEFGVAKILYFHSMLLMGTYSGKSYEPGQVAFPENLHEIRRR